jgi:hypothetical protein
MLKEKNLIVALALKNSFILTTSTIQVGAIHELPLLGLVIKLVQDGTYSLNRR